MPSLASACHLRLECYRDSKAPPAFLLSPTRLQAEPEDAGYGSDGTSSEDDTHADDEYAPRSATLRSSGKTRTATSASNSAYFPLAPSGKQESTWTSYLSIFELNSNQKNVLKCSLAYLFASFFTYIGPLSDLVGSPFDADGPVANVCQARP